MNKAKAILIYFSLILIITISSQKDKTIKIHYIQTARDYFVLLPIGTPKKYFIFTMILDIGFSWKVKEIFEASSSPTYQTNGEYTFINDGKNKTGTSVSDQLFFEDNSLLSVQFNFLLIDNNNSISSQELGEFSLAYKYTDLNYSLIHQLKENNLIDKSMFTLDSATSFLYLGSMPQENNDSKYKGQCQVDTNQSKWSCQLSQVTINDDNDNNYINTYYSYFQTNIKYILVPHDFMIYLNKTVFEPLSQQSDTHCFYTQKNGYQHYYYCRNINVKALPVISFTFDSNIYKFNMSYFFDTYNENIMECAFHEDTTFSNQWVFGLPFLNLFSSVFDYDHNSITFYSKDYIGRVEHKRMHSNSLKQKYLKLIEIILGLILSPSVSFLVFLKLRGVNKIE